MRIYFSCHNGLLQLQSETIEKLVRLFSDNGWRINKHEMGLLGMSHEDMTFEINPCLVDTSFANEWMSPRQRFEHLSTFDGLVFLPQDRRLDGVQTEELGMWKELQKRGRLPLYKTYTLNSDMRITRISQESLESFAC